MKKTTTLLAISSIFLVSLSPVSTIFAQGNNSKESTYSAIEENTNIVSGEFGTSKWNITSDGVLHIGDGEFPSWTNDDSPWKKYDSQINSVIFDGSVKAGTKAHGLFALSNITKIENISNFDVSEANSLRCMFAHTTNLISLDLSSFNTSNAIDLSLMFWRSGISQVNVTSFNTSKTTNVYNMFLGTANLRTLDLSSFDLTNITNGTMMIYDSGIQHLKLGPLFRFEGNNAMQYAVGSPSHLAFTTEPFIGRWQKDQTGPLYRAYEFVNAFSNNPEQLAGDWYWATSQQSISADDFTMYIGDPEPTVSNFNAVATDKYGSPSEVTADLSNVNFNNTGTYPVLLNSADGQIKEVTLSIKEKTDHTSINVKDSTIYVGDSWTAQDNFDSAFDRDGNAIELSQITIDGSKVDTSRPGIYEVLYTYNEVISIATVNVKENKKAINVHNITLSIGDAWKPQDNFDSAFDKDGKAVDFSKLSVDSSKVDTSKSGIYEVIYILDDVRETATVTVKEKNGNVPVPPKTDSNSDSDQLDIPNSDNNDEVKMKKTNQKTLPKTGDSSEISISVIFIVLLLGSMLILKKQINKIS